MTANNLDAQIDAVFSPQTSRETRTFPSGAVSIVIRERAHTAVIDGGADGEWGVSIDPSDDTAMAGHDSVTTSLAEALTIAREGLLSRD